MIWCKEVTFTHNLKQCQQLFSRPSNSSSKTKNTGITSFAKHYVMCEKRNIIGVRKSLLWKELNVKLVCARKDDGNFVLLGVVYNPFN